MEDETDNGRKGRWEIVAGLWRFINILHKRLSKNIQSESLQCTPMVEARKRPPTLRHLPTNQGMLFSCQYVQELKVITAKRLKQTWVENNKIKSKWKAQKRKEPHPTSVQPDEQHGSTKEDDSESDGKESDQQERDLARDVVIPALKRSAVHMSRAHKIHGLLPPFKGSRNDKHNGTPAKPTPSLRDLTQKAYSTSSLHTFKSDPLNRRRGSGTRGVRGGGRGMQRGQGHRGQPNMKLRMDAMLEKIKRDFV